jgi:hypothetical protein
VVPALIGKGLGGGVLPLAAVIAREDLDVAPDRALGHYTHEKNPVLCAAALATIDYIEIHGLVTHARELGRYTLERLGEMKARHPLIGDVRAGLSWESSGEGPADGPASDEAGCAGGSAQTTISNILTCDTIRRRWTGVRLSRSNAEVENELEPAEDILRGR